MRKRLTILWATMLCVCGLVLAACSGGAGEGTASDSGESAAAEETTSEKKSAPTKADDGSADQKKAQASDKFCGTWLMASMKSEGLTVVTDFSDFNDGANEAGIVIKDDGTASMTFDDSTLQLTWEMVDDDTIALTEVVSSGYDDDDDDDDFDIDDDDDDRDDDDDDDFDIDDNDDDDDDPNDVTDAEDVLANGGLLEGETIEVDYRDGALVIVIDTTDFTGEITYTQDGTIEELPRLENVKTEQFARADELVGEWKLAAMCSDEVTMYGDSDVLAQTSGLDATLLLEEGGSATFMGSSFSWSLGDTGASLSVNGSSIPLLKTADGRMIMDMTGISGEDDRMLVCFSK